MTTAAVVAYHRNESEVRMSYAGHPPVLYKRASDKVWSYIRSLKCKGQRNGFPRNLPFGVDLNTHYTELRIPVVPGDRIFVYTDGIIDAPNSLGEPFGFTRLKNVLDENSEASPSDLKSAVIRTLNQYSEEQLNHDDITLIAMEIR